MYFNPPRRQASKAQIAQMTGSGPKAAHHRAESGSNWSMNWARGVSSTTAGSQPLSRIDSTRVVSNGPTTVASDQPNDAMISAHGQASSID